MNTQQSLPHEYREMTARDIDREISRIREELGPDLVILGHHYQGDGVIKHADFTGDSLRLAQLAAEQEDARYVVFCGVLFMAETADILKTKDQAVILPHVEAGCPMADMADYAQLERCWDRLVEELGDDIIPVTYVNSSAEVKAFCGDHGGATCTSSSATQVLGWALDRARHVLFLPDQYLGTNTAENLGLSEAEIALYRREEDRVVTAGSEPRIILWDGYCPVHREFTADMVAAVRKNGAEVVVHPECRPEVARSATEQGSTDYIRKRIADAEPGSTWAVGTEEKLVARLARQYPELTVLSLREGGSVCEDMDLITPAHLLWVLANLEEGRVVNRIVVPEEIAAGARRALDRMFCVVKGQ